MVGRQLDDDNANTKGKSGLQHIHSRKLVMVFASKSVGGVLFLELCVPCHQSSKVQSHAEYIPPSTNERVSMIICWIHG